MSAERITVNGKKLGSRRDKAFYREVQMVFQDPYGSLHLPPDGRPAAARSRLLSMALRTPKARIVRALD